MFQYASLRGIADNRGFDFCVPPNDETRIHDYNLFNFFEMIHCKSVGYKELPTFYGFTAEDVQTQFPHSSLFEFSEMLFNECPDNVSINGFFQSEKYFMHIRNEILEDFTFKKDYTLPAENYIALHVRRGDYILSGNNFINCSVDYYNAALSTISSDLPVVVVSDDIEWCKQNIRGDFFMEGGTLDHDLYIMTKATHNIIANSTYSWWGAWLNQHDDQIVIAPRGWFGPTLAHHNTKDLIPEGWIKI